MAVVDSGKILVLQIGENSENALPLKPCMSEGRQTSIFPSLYLYKMNRKANVRQWLTYIKYKVLQMNPLGTRKKSEPQMRFEPTTLRDLVRML